MANLSETVTWEPGIYQLEEEDLVQGGPDGIDNVQGKQLANRTAYLKQQIELALGDMAGHLSAADPHTQYATELWVAAQVAALVNAAPGALDTLNELASALGNDANFATTVTNALSLKAPIASPLFTGSPSAPTPAQFDADGSLSTTEFVQRALGNLSGGSAYTATGNIPASDSGKFINVSNVGAITMTMPNLTDVPMGAAFRIYNSNQGTCTLVGYSGQTFTHGGNTPVSSVSIPKFQSIEIIRYGANWGVFTPDAGLAQSQVFGASLSGNGYQNLPSGLIVQWGISAVTTTSASVTFPIAFPNYVAHVNTHDQSSGGSITRSTFQVNDVTKTGFVATNIGTLTRGSTTFNAVSNSGCPWIAIGY